MDLITWLLREHHGIARARVIAGRTGRPELRRLVAAGALEKVRHGWYAVPEARADVRAAVRAGGALSCVSALKVRGVWVPDHQQIHVRPSDHARRQPAGVSGVRRCAPRGRDLPVPRSVDPIGTALQAAASCVTGEELVAISDSLLNRGLCREDDLSSWLAAHPVADRRLLAWIDPLAQSGTESLARFRIARMGVAVQSQVHFDGVGLVDLLLGKRLVVEIDSIEHHTSLANYLNDRHRDRILVARGYIVVRLTYHDVMFHWDRVVRDLLAIIRRRDHLRDPRDFAVA